jgi:outer membrane protein
MRLRVEQPVFELKRNLRGTVARAALLAASAYLLAVPVNAESLNEALAAAYRYNPSLDAQRAFLRAQDENVARAMSGYRPVITGSADVNYQYNNTRPDTVGEGESKPRGYSVDAVQPIFNGFQTVYAVKTQEANVRAGRETLRAVEQNVLLDGVTSYMDVVRDQAIVRLRENNVNVLTRELKATQDRFSVGEVTRTDVAQAQARRAGAVSALDLARANLKTSRASYERVIGHAPDSVTEPHGFEGALPRSLEEAVQQGTHENPAVVGALYSEEAARHSVDQIRGQLLPSVQLEANYTDRFPGGGPTSLTESETTTVTGRLTVPIYEGGDVYAQVRQAKQNQVGFMQQIEQARSETEANVVAAWSRLLAAKAQTESGKSQVEANTTALTGVREEERVGQRTLLDVLNAEVELLNSQVELVTIRRDYVVSSYAVLATIGRLDAVSLGLTTVAYDPEAHYHEVRRKPWGTSITPAESGRGGAWEATVEPVK